MAARIRSLRNGLNPIDEASRDDLSAADVMSLTALDPATTYAWTLAFVPDGSAATFSGDPTAISPGAFTVDLVGPYLVRLTIDAGLVTEDTQYVRLRALTTALGLHLVAAGERRDTTGIIPVDVDSEGWANEQNANLQALEAAAVIQTVIVADQSVSLGSCDTLDFIGGGVSATAAAGTATIDIPGGYGPAVEILATPYGVGVGDGVLLINVGGPAVVNLPAIATYTGPGLRIKDRSGLAFFNPITINANGAETIDGAGFITIATNYGSVDLIPLGTEWSVF